ncbi:probable cytochrome P450 12a5, mitochondrial [Argonauta hians]
MACNLQVWRPFTLITSTYVRRYIRQMGLTLVRPATTYNIPKEDIECAAEPNIREKTINDIPGPTKLPLIGSAWLYFHIKSPTQIRKLNEFLHKNYGDIVAERLPGNKNIIHLYRPEDFEIVYRNEGPYPIRGVFPLLCTYNNKYNNGIYGLTTSEGKYWKHTRSAVQKKLFRLEYTHRLFKEHKILADEFLGLLDSRKGDDGVVSDLNKILERYTLEGIATTCFKERLDTDWTDMRGSQQGIQYLETLKKSNVQIMKSLLSFPLYMYFETPLFKQFSNLTQQLDRFIENKMLVEVENFTKRQCPHQTRPETDDKKMVCPMEAGSTSLENGLLCQLLRENKLNKQEITTIIKDIIASSVFTLRSLLSFVLYALTQHPETQEELRQEIRNVIFNSDSDEITQNTFSKMPYLKAFVKETLRYYPVIPGNFRQLFKEINIRGYTIPKGTYVKMHHIWPAMSEEFFENATEFKPNRWLRDSPEREITHPFAVMQFGFGPRSCLGKRLALTETYLFIIKILSKYSVQYPKDTFEIVTELQHHPPSDLKFKFIDCPIDKTS